MTKPKDESKQLQLRLLVDVGALSSEKLTLAQETPLGMTVVHSSQALHATEQDMQVYQQISGNYFRSLHKV